MKNICSKALYLIHKLLSKIRAHLSKIRYWFNWPLVGCVNFGSLRRLAPISRIFGYDRGDKSINRYYIDGFIEKHSLDIKGRVLEVGDNVYTLRCGGNRVVQSDILHVTSGNPKATIIADLTNAQNISSDCFDCVILTQVLQFIYDVRSALYHCHRILKPGGVLLVTLSGLCQISRYDMDRWGEYWHFTTLSAKRLFDEFFSPESVSIEASGNVLSAIALLQGLTSSELTSKDLEHNDPDYEILITVRAVKK